MERLTRELTEVMKRHDLSEGMMNDILESVKSNISKKSSTYTVNELERSSLKDPETLLKIKDEAAKRKLFAGLDQSLHATLFEDSSGMEKTYTIYLVKA